MESISFRERDKKDVLYLVNVLKKEGCTYSYFENRLIYLYGEFNSAKEKNLYKKNV